MYKVKEVSKMSGVTIKTLHYYHKIELLVPSKIANNKYRLYSDNDLLRLQEIIFYRQLNISIKKIFEIFNGTSSRLEILEDQISIMNKELNKIKILANALENSIKAERKGETMNKDTIFKGLSDLEWDEALKDHNEYIKNTYNYEIPKVTNVDKQNLLAKEAKNFSNDIIELLTNKVSASDEKALNRVREHIEILNSNGNNFSTEDYLKQTEFFISDDFHRNILESQQVGFAYYLNNIARALNTK